MPSDVAAELFVVVVIVVVVVVIVVVVVAAAAAAAAVAAVAAAVAIAAATVAIAAARPAARGSERLWQPSALVLAWSAPNLVEPVQSNASLRKNVKKPC